VLHNSAEDLATRDVDPEIAVTGQALLPVRVVFRWSGDLADSLWRELDDTPCHCPPDLGPSNTEISCEGRIKDDRVVRHGANLSPCGMTRRALLMPFVGFISLLCGHSLGGG
jgi:hypothetical protein